MTDDRNEKMIAKKTSSRYDKNQPWEIFYIFLEKLSLYIFPLRHCDRPEITGVAEARLAGNNDKVGASTAS